MIVLKCNLPSLRRDNAACGDLRSGLAGIAAGNQCPPTRDPSV